MADFDEISKTNTLIAGQPIQYTRSTRTLHIAGDEIPVERWLEIRRQIDLVIKRSTSPEEWKGLRETMAWLGKRDHLPTELREYEQPSREAHSDFLNANFKTIMAQPKGRRIATAPWWLRWLFPAVLTRGDA